MRFLQFGSIHYSFEKYYSDGGRNKDQNQNYMIEILSNHIKCFVRSVSNQKDVCSVT